MATKQLPGLTTLLPADSIDSTADLMMVRDTSTNADVKVKVGTVVGRDHGRDVNQVPLNSYLAAVTAGGSANALTADLNPPLTALIPGMPINIKAAAANLGAVTLNVNGLGAVAIKKAGVAALDAGDIVAGQVFQVAYDGTNFQMLSAYSLLDYATSTGSANAYVLTLAPALPAYTDGRQISFKAHTIPIPARPRST